MTHTKYLATLLLCSFVSMLGSIMLGSEAVAQTRLSPEPRVWDTPNNELSELPLNPSIHFMVAGPMGGYRHEELDPTRWRIALSCEEVYCSVTFDYIEHQQEYEGFPRIVATYWLNGADIAPVIDPNSDFLHDIHFVAWESWNRVLLREYDRYFHIEINPDRTFTIIPLKSL